MNLLSVEGLSKSYGAKILFEDISFGISRGEKVALIARNGAGKTTLINIIKGLEIPDTGRVTLRKQLSISFLDQNPNFDMKKTILETIQAINNPIRVLIDDYNSFVKKSEDEPTDFNFQRLEELTQQMTELNAWEYENRWKEILSRLNIRDLNQLVGTLSGGQQKRLALAQLLINQPELLVMDEPTNHLDVEMIEWLEDYLRDKDMSVLLVTHDRYFLDEVCNRIVEIEDKKLYQYNGNFQYYLDKKSARELSQASELEKAKNLYRRELEWIRKSPRARGTKQKARVDAFTKVEEKATASRTQDKVELSVKVTRLGGKILELINLEKAFGEKKLFQGFSYTFKKGEKIGVAGKNGAGKSTFLDILLGNTQPDRGKIQTGETVVFGYYSQGGMKLSEDKRVIELVKEIAEFIPMADGSKLSASQLLQRFNFPPEVQFGFVSKLSGGEKRRLYLMTILIRNPNFLILDEPTNDLDIATLQTLEEFLENYAGCVLIVSHDRYFMDKLVDHVFVFEGDGVIKDFPGSYSEYRYWKKNQVSNPVKETTLSEPAPENPIRETNTETTGSTAKLSAKKLSFKEKFELENLEKEIGSLEKEKKEIEELLITETDHEKILHLSQRFAEVSTILDTHTLRWMELSE